MRIACWARHIAEPSGSRACDEFAGQMAGLLYLAGSRTRNGPHASDSRAMRVARACGDRRLAVRLDACRSASNSKTSGCAAIALHARQLGFNHPMTNEPVDVIAPTPPAWEQFDLPSHHDDVGQDWRLLAACAFVDSQIVRADAG